MIGYVPPASVPRRTESAGLSLSTAHSMQIISVNFKQRKELREALSSVSNVVDEEVLAEVAKR